MQVVQHKTSEKDNNLIKQFWYKYIPYWPLFLIFGILAVGGAWFYLKHKTPLYESTASILIKDETKGQDDSKMEESLNQLSSKKTVENEMQVLSSRELMYEVVKKLHLYAPVYREGKLRPESAYAFSPVVIESDNPDAIEETKKEVFFNYDAVKGKVVIGNTPYTLNEWVKTPYGTLKFIPQNVSYTPEKSRSLYFRLINPNNVALSLIGGLDVSAPNKLSSIVALKIRDEVPQKANDILNTLMDVYREASINEKNKLAVHTLSFVDNRLKSVSHDLDSIEKKLEEYKSANNAIDISSQGSIFLQNVGAVDQKLSDVNSQLAVLNQVQDYVQRNNKSGGNIALSTVGIGDPRLSQYLEKLTDLELKREEMKKTTPENNPLMISIDDQINKIKPSVLENIKSQKSSLEASRNNLNNTNNKFYSTLGLFLKRKRILLRSAASKMY